MYKNIRKTKKAVAPLQETKKGAVKKRSKGRPTRPNMKRYTIKMDINLHERISIMSEKIGTSISFLINQSVRAYLKKHKNNL